MSVLRRTAARIWLVVSQHSPAATRPWDEPCDGRSAARLRSRPIAVNQVHLAQHGLSELVPGGLRLVVIHPGFEAPNRLAQARGEEFPDPTSSLGSSRRCLSQSI